MTERAQEMAQGLLRLSAQKLWAERSNPLSMPVATWIGCLRTDDRLTWRSTDGIWQAQLERSPSGGHVSICWYCRDVYVGRYDERGWHAPRAGVRRRRPRPSVTSLPLPLAS